MSGSCVSLVGGGSGRAILDGELFARPFEWNGRYTLLTYGPTPATAKKLICRPGGGKLLTVPGILHESSP
jgi:hypothetical protein